MADIGHAREGAIGRLDPRRHLAAAIGWLVFVIVALASLVAANLAADAAERTALAETELLLEQFAAQIRHALDMNLNTRLSIVQATAAQIAASGDHGRDALRRHLEAVQSQFPEFAWLGVTDTRGRVLAATGGILQGDSVVERSWYSQARSAPYLGEVHDAPLLEKALPHSPDSRPSRFLDAAAPISDGSGHAAGVVGGLLAWDWIDRLQGNLLATLDTRRELELLLANADGLVLVGPPAWVGRTLNRGDDLSDGGAYTVGRYAGGRAGDTNLRWTTVVRQPSATALAPVRHVRSTVFITVLLAGLAAAAAAVALTRLPLRRLAVLSGDAQAVRRGQRSTIAAPAGKDEIAHIGATMSELVGHLQREKAALAALNAELDTRVVERTARIERMAEEARYAAVTRERVRLARDLHDTLAHSLMALLTQIRLVRKLKARLSADELEGELARAEEAAASGLADARAAIDQMRHNSVRDTGLAAALHELLERFGERTGIEVALRAESPAADMADERAETVFRIVEEALHNVERHARARCARVTVAAVPSAPAADARTAVSVEDDGIGFDTTVPHPGHYGLIGIGEQAALIGAHLSVRSVRGQGTSIRLEFPA